LGLGPAAVSYIAGERFGNPENLDEYLALIEMGKLATTWRERLSAEKRAGEALVLALRMAEGVVIDEFSQAHSFDLNTLIVSDLAPYLERGLLTMEDGHLKLTLEGMLLSNEVFLSLV
jgi:oxygen-independent coproporphyrinogen-3 oxidase